MSTSELAKSYDPQAEEPQAKARWNDARPFHADPSAPGESYAIVIPPPNVTAALHLGHALNNTLQDVLIRFHRSRGYNTLWMPGTDHAGIATQTVVEKRLLADEGKRRTDFQRDEFISRVQAWKDEYEATILEQLRVMGCSCDWDRNRFTMDDTCVRAVRACFYQLFKDGLIFRGKRLVNWDPATQTALADDEVENEEVEGRFYYLRYPVVDDAGNDTDEFVTVATTRPETMLGDTAVAVNPHDDQARAKFIGKRVRLPIINRIIPVIADDYVVKPDPDSDDAKAKYASGFLKVTPAHDQNDWLIGLRHDLAAINVLAPDGSISRDHGWPEDEWTSGQANDAEPVLGMDRFVAREWVVKYFEEHGLLAETKPYTHTVGHSYRSKVPIEPYLSDQWYVKVTDDRLAGAALRAMVPDQRAASDGCVWKDEASFDSKDESWDGQLRFYPPRYAKTFQTWHENLRDWCISRQLWWGHRIPVWKIAADKCTLGVDITMTSEDEVLRPVTCMFEGVEISCAGRTGEDGDTVYVCVPQDQPDIERALEAIGYVQDDDVLDTWFSSALWPMSTMGWPHVEDNDLLARYNPTNVLCTAREIITLWVSRMVMFNTYFLKQLPFKDVFIHAMILDGEGRKMSKSLGNGVDPRDIVRTKGADAMRFTLAHMTTQTQDVRMPVEYDEGIGANSSPKFEIGRRLSNKLWNATRYAVGTLGRAEGTGDPGGTPTRLIDQWMLSRLARTARDVQQAMAEYQFNPYAQGMYDLFWRDFCDWYLEGIKPTVLEDAVQQSVLRASLSSIHRMFAPIIPFITESLHDAVESLSVEPIASIELAKSPVAASTGMWPRIPETLINDDAEATFDQVRALVSAIREVRSGHTVDDRRRITLHVTDKATALLIENSGGIVETFAGLDEVTTDAAPDDGVSFVHAGVEHALSNLTEAIDVDAERTRLERRQSELQKQIGGLKGRLSNPGYVDKAPKHLVDESRQQLEDGERELEGVTQALAKLG